MSALAITPLESFGTGQVFWSMLWFFCFFIWIWLLIRVFADIFRSHDMSGWAKALWIVFVIVLPYLGVLVYLIARGKEMSQHSIDDARAVDAAQRAVHPERGRRRRREPRGRDRASGRPQGEGRHRRRRVPGRQGQGARGKLRRAGTRSAVMCRWLAYSGAPVNLEELLFKPKNSLVIQSKHSKMGATTTNGDGFGVGWYGVGETPGRLPQHRAGLERPQPARAVGPGALAAGLRPHPGLDGVRGPADQLPSLPARELAVDAQRRRSPGSRR